MLRTGFVPIALKGITGISPEDRSALRDPKLREDKTKGIYEGINQFLFKTDANHGEAKAEQLCARESTHLKATRRGRGGGTARVPGLKEADAFFIRKDTPLPPPHVRREDWPKGA